MSPDWCMERCSENGGFSHPKKKAGGYCFYCPIVGRTDHIHRFLGWFQVSHSFSRNAGVFPIDLLMSYVLPIDLLMHMEVS